MLMKFILNFNFVELNVIDSRIGIVIFLRICLLFLFYVLIIKFYVFEFFNFDF